MPLVCRICWRLCHISWRNGGNADGKERRQQKKRALQHAHRLMWQRRCAESAWQHGILCGRLVYLTCQMTDNNEAAKGYQAGREWYFHEAEPNERRCTDAYILERLWELVQENPSTQDVSLWYYCLACMIGELSGQLFPKTQQEKQAWIDECNKYTAKPRSALVTVF